MPSRRHRRPISIFFCLLWLAICISQTGCATGSKHNHADITAIDAQLAPKGIRFESLRLTGSDHFVDFRFRVLDSQKAGGILNRKEDAYLLHERTGLAFSVPMTKVGPMRATALGPKVGRSYVILFANNKKIIKEGDPVRVVVGDFKSDQLRIGMARETEIEKTPEEAAAWKTLQRDLFRAYTACSKACVKDQTCQQQCRQTYEDALSKAYLETLKP